MTSNNQGATMKQVELQDGASADIVQENVQHLKELFPDAFTENGVNFDTLRQLLGDLKVLDEGEEKYGLNWHGKKQARQIALTPSLGTLLPCPEESVDWDTTQNLFIEGDNLEVLKLLQKSYANKVKMIYIDPPYNTDGDFIYPDKFSEGLDTYLKYTGQKDEDGWNVSKSGQEKTGRKHTNWLSMMYSRLKVAKDLLKPEGILAVHIDENEYSNLDQILNEIFGEENNLGAVVWDKRNPKGKVGGVAQQHEYIFFICKNKEALTSGDFFYRKKENAALMLKKAEDFVKKHGGVNEESRQAYRKWTNDPKNNLSGGEKAYCLIDEDGDVYRPVSMAAPDKPETRSHRPLIHPKTKQSCPVPEKGWRFPDKSMDELLAKGKILFGVDESTQPQQKYLLKENMKEAVPSLLYFGGSDDALGLPFDNPKPVAVVAKLIEAACYDNDIVIDFFAGSATTAHACMKLNAEEGRSLRYIMVQLPEPTTEKSAAYKAGFKTISDLSKERIRRAAKKIKDENPAYEGDLGFKVFKLASSNIKVWNPDRTDLESSLLDHKEHLVEGRSEQDILYELLLKRGVDLTTPIETREIAGKNVYSIGFGKIITCLDDLIAANDVEPLASGIIAWQKELKDTLDVKVLETHVFFKDSAFRDDVAKTNMAAILSQNGIDHVRSL
jgi:adenine-specific DNA-methyltransferase